MQQPSQDPRETIPVLSNDELFRIYREPSSSKMNMNFNTVTTVGTGGVCIWERSWKEIALSITLLSEYQLLSEVDRPGVARAMYIAEAAAHLSRMHIQNLSTQFFSLSKPGTRPADTLRKLWTGTGDNKEKELMEEELARIESAITERNKRASSYMSRHPKDGQERFALLENIASDTLETGQHLVYLALYNGPRELMKQGRRLINMASIQLDANVDSPDQDEHFIHEATRGSTEGQKALAYVNLVFTQCSQVNPACHHTVRDFIATAYTARYAHQAATRNMDRLAELGAKHGGFPTTVRHLSDATLWDKKHGQVAQARNALARNHDIQAESAFTELINTEETLAAIAYGHHHNQQHPTPTCQEILNHITGQGHQPKVHQLADLGRSMPDWQHFYEDSASWAFQQPDHREYND